ncbi:putative BTB domain-containing protein [Seiridium cardinale]|uniref:BTB domain-containing protein n=1 Tax=Seiridium cardinale TaxID=138064 RepID=A0ABR2XW62_9PEZI
MPRKSTAKSVRAVSSLTTEFDDDGDLRLRVGAEIGACEAHEFLVCSRTMSRASKVWRTMLYGNFSEAKRPKAEWSVDLPEDNPSAMKTVLSIIHTRWNITPKLDSSIALEDLYQLTVLTDKYALTHILSPWASSWADRVYGTLTGEGHDILHLEKQAWIAWELGDRELLQKVAQLMILHPEFTIDQQERIFTETLEPTGFQDILDAQSLGIKTKLLSLFSLGIQALIKTPKDPGHSDCQKPCLYGHFSEADKREHRGCMDMMLGYMIRFLTENRLWPIPPPTTVILSPYTLADTLRAMKFGGPSNHTLCQPIGGLKDKISKILSDSIIDISKSQEKHLKTQAVQSGLFK